MIPRLKPYYNKRELLAAFTPSKGKISKYENSFAETFGCKYGTMFSYGRTALYALFKAWKLNDHEIICPAYTCVVVQHSIVLSGNVPVFVDCEKGSYNMSYEGLKDAITERTRAVIVTHLFGYPMDVNLVQSIIKEAELKYGNKIYVVQDAAHSFGCKWEGEMVTQFGDAAIFGLNVSKIINSVFGGIAITNSENTHKGLREFRSSQIKPCGFGKTIKRLSYLIAIYIAFNPMVYRITIWLERLGFLDKFILY